MTVHNDAQQFHAKIAQGNPALTIDDVTRHFDVLESPRSPGANAAAQDALARSRSTTPFDGPYAHAFTGRKQVGRHRDPA